MKKKIVKANPDLEHFQIGILDNFCNEELINFMEKRSNWTLGLLRDEIDQFQASINDHDENDPDFFALLPEICKKEIKANNEKISAHKKFLAELKKLKAANEKIEKLK